MRIVITGAGGFIGANLIRALLARGDEVHALVRPDSAPWRLSDIASSVTLHRADVTDAPALAHVMRTVDPEVVYHLAHYGGNVGETDPAMVRRVIIDGTAALYDACRTATNLRAVVHAGSSSEYGAKRVPMKEDMMPEPATDYAVAKVWATLWGEHMRREASLPVTTLRLFNIYGPYEAKARFFPGVILSLLRGESPKLANPATVRDFTYVDDAVRAFLLAPQKPFGVYNIGTGTQTTLREAAEAVKAEIGSHVELPWGEYPSRSFDSAFWQADTNRAREILDWSAECPLAEGVRRSVKWFKENKNLYE